MTAFRTVIKNSSYQLASRLLSRLLFLAFVIYAASKLGPELFGMLSFALATVELLSSVGDLGLTRYGVRELVRDWEHGPVLVGQILALQVATSVFFTVIGLIAVLAWQPAYPKLLLLLIGLVAIFLSGIVNTTETILIARQKFFYSALFTFIGRVIYISAGFAALAAGASVVIVMWGFLAALVLELIARASFTFPISGLSFRFPLARLWRMLRATVPFAVSAAASIVFLRINVMVLELLKGDAAVGVFNVAFTFFIPFIWIPMILFRTIFPGLTELWATNRERARLNTWQWWRFTALTGIPVALAISMLAGPVLSRFPAGYEDSSIVLAILIWALPLMMNISLAFNVLQAIDHERDAAMAQTVGAVATVASSFLLIPFFGVIGAAVATLVGAFCMWMFSYGKLYSNFFHRHLIPLFLKPIMAGAVMGGITLAAWPLTPLVATFLGLLAYGATILATKGVTIAEVRHFLGKRTLEKPVQGR